MERGFLPLNAALHELGENGSMADVSFLRARGARIAAVGLCLGGFLGTGVLWACQVPVFRFALERWVADPYQVVVTPGVSGTFSEEESAAIELLKANQLGSVTNESGILANLNLTVQEEPAEGGGTESARLTISYPTLVRGYAVKPIWEGDLTLETVRGLLDSPVRRELVRRLLSGESAVWVLVESGDPELDDPAADLMSAALEKGEGSLRIPDGVMTREQAEKATHLAAINSDDVLQSEVPLKIDFSLLRLSRDDPAEAMFLPMLLNIEDDLGEYAEEPMVFPVFGRGRLLEPLIGRGINEDNALDYAAYICGACSCEVKNQNPGQDLLVAADWDSALAGSEVVIEKILPPLEGTGILAAAASESNSPEATPDSEAIEESTDSPPVDGMLKVGVVWGIAAALVAILVILAIGTIVILRRNLRS